MTDPAEALKGDQMEVKTDREFIAWCRADQFDHLPEGYFDRLLALSKGSPYYGTTALCDIAELRLDLAEAREDTARLTFMFGDPENGASHDQLTNIWENAVTLRGARAEIDAARGKA